jgi:hypothetical protein
MGFGIRHCSIGFPIVLYVGLVIMVVRMVPLKSVDRIILPSTTNLESALKKAKELKEKSSEEIDSSLPPLQLLTSIFIR